MEAAHLAHLARSGQTLMSKVKCPSKAMEQARRMTILGLVECTSSQGYTEWEPKYHLNGRHNNISLTLRDDCCREGHPQMEHGAHGSHHVLQGPLHWQTPKGRGSTQDV